MIDLTAIADESWAGQLNSRHKAMHAVQLAASVQRADMQRKMHGKLHSTIHGHKGCWHGRSGLVSMQAHPQHFYIVSESLSISQLLLVESVVALADAVLS